MVRGAAAKCTEEAIRRDLDHIHNLAVIEVRFVDGDVVVATNSISNALFARTCMMSRTAYKGLRIDWCRDECAGPLPTPSAAKARVPEPRKAPVSPAFVNRFSLLNADVSEADSDSESYLSNGGIGVGNWADATAA